MPCCLFCFFVFLLMECHVVFGKMLYGMDVVYKSDTKGYIQLFFFRMSFYLIKYYKFYHLSRDVVFWKRLQNSYPQSICFEVVFLEQCLLLNLCIYIYIFLICSVLRNVIFFKWIDLEICFEPVQSQCPMSSQWYYGINLAHFSIQAKLQL